MLIKRILVPIDFSMSSREAVEAAVYLAESLKASIVLLHVYELPGAMSTIVPGASTEHDIQEERETSDLELSAIVEQIKASGLMDVEALARAGFPIETILTEARTGGFHLIIMGTHGRTGVARLLMGSVAEGVLRKAACPVMTIHLPNAPP